MAESGQKEQKRRLFVNAGAGIKKRTKAEKRSEKREKEEEKRLKAILQYGNHCTFMGCFCIVVVVDSRDNRVGYSHCSWPHNCSIFHLFFLRQDVVATGHRAVLQNNEISSPG